MEDVWLERPKLSFLERSNTRRRNRSEEVEIEDSQISKRAFNNLQKKKRYL